MKLSKLLERATNVEVAGGDVDVGGLALDSRAVRRGDLFAALPGVAIDGRDYIPQALDKGAVAVLAAPPLAADQAHALETRGATLVLDDNPRRRLSLMAARFYGCQPETVVAVTGTNGKTSVASFARQLWQRLGRKAASVGTLGVDSDALKREGGLTTPDQLSLHSTLKDLAEAGVDHAALEASSHGLAQYRLDGVKVSVAAFTNLTRDHLDYHDSAENYLAAKARLFTEVLAEDGTAVVNIDGEGGREIAELARARGVRVLTVGWAEDADMVIHGLSPCPTGLLLTVGYEGRMMGAVVPLHGAFQAENALLAAAMLIASGEVPEDVFPALESLSGVPGRFEFAGKTPSGGRVFIDYAHTPDGLENILNAARLVTPGSLDVVFGCGGDRDPGKRPLMGEIALRLADRVYVTDDNPRGEDPAQIRKEILAAAPGAEEFDDRTRAIRAAVAELKDGDVLVVTGKGHETGQLVGGKVLPFNDFEEVEAAIAALPGDNAGGPTDAV